MTDIQEQIIALKKEKNAVILAHFYQTMDIQEIADHVGDSFELAKRAREAAEDIIVLCGVRFMAESAKILNPQKTVLLPASQAGCPMADMVSPEDVRALRLQYPDAAVVCYINSSAAVKAECDICCTSSSAVKVVKSLSQKKIIFVPDQNLGAYAAQHVPEKEFVLFEGYCPIHNQVKPEDIDRAMTAHPEAKVLVHPECPAEVLKKADYVGSTAGILQYVKESGNSSFMIGTEVGVVDRLRVMFPQKQVYLLTPGLVCSNMKKTRLDDVLYALKNNAEEITLTSSELEHARLSLERMVAVN